MRAQPRQSLAFSLSVVAHASAVLWGTLTLAPKLDLPKIELEFTEVEFIDPNQLMTDEVGEPARQPVGPPPPPADAKAEDDGKGPAADDDGEEDRKPFAKKSSRVDQLAPGNSRLTAFVAIEKIRKLPFADEGVEILAPWPDFEFIIQGAGFDTLHDFDYIVLATPDVRIVTQTFIAVKSKLPTEEIKKGVERAVARDDQVIEWEEKHGRTMGNPRPSDPEREDTDPRYFVFLDDGVAMYVREEFLPAIEAGPGQEKTAGNFIANLTKFRRYAAREPRAGMQVVAKSIRQSLRRIPTLPGGLPFPDGIELMAEASEQPEIVIRMTFLSADEARQAKTWWHTFVKQLLDQYSLQMKMMGFGPVVALYDDIEANVRGKNLVLRGRFAKEDAEHLMRVSASMSQMFRNKDSKEVEAARQEREENWRKRNGGKLPPSAIDAHDEDAKTAPPPGEPDDGAAASPAPEVKQTPPPARETDSP